MNFELQEIIANLIIGDDAESRLECQQEALSESACVSPMLGQWIDDNDVQYLLASMSLRDDDFARMFPPMANTPRRRRQQIATTLENHFESCRHCALKRAYDLGLDARINRVCSENRHRLLQLFQNNETATIDEEHLGEYWLSNPVWAAAQSELPFDLPPEIHRHSSPWIE